jgi:PRC-barrel domain.
MNPSMKKSSLALAAALFAGTAVAQTGVPSSAATTETATSEIVVALAPGGLLLGDKPTVAVKYVAVQPTDLVTSSIVGATIYNVDGEALGEVADLVLSEGDTVTGVVASVGGFLGIGESYVILDPATVTVNQKDGEWSAYVHTTKEDLTSAPKFEYPKSAG